MSLLAGTLGQMSALTNPTSGISRSSRSVVGLFAGIGGLELGLHASGFRSALLCDVEPAAQRVLSAHFPGCAVVGDVRELIHVPAAEVLVGGFPCQDLSQAGRTVGIAGERSGLVGEVFRLMGEGPSMPDWLLLENVPFMLQLDRGKAMSFLADELEKRGLTWAYRVVDTRAFGLPQRRKRVILLASRDRDPREVLFADEAQPRDFSDRDDIAYGFYWTEGLRGLGWGDNAVPTIKGGSTIGIPSPPAIWMPDGRIVTPDIRDAERMQGFPVDWTEPGAWGGRRRSVGRRWKLVGNAVSVPVAEWVGRRLAEPGSFDASREQTLPTSGSWPQAAWGRAGERHAVDITSWPVREPYQDLLEFLQFEPKMLSERATAGFLKRARASRLRFREGFLDAVDAHLDVMRSTALAS